MSDLYSELEANIATLLRNAEALSAVKTVESDVRECLFSGDKLVEGFRPEELPAINVSAEIRPTKGAAFTSGEASYEIPVSVLVIVRAQRKKVAREKARELQLAVEAVLSGARRSDNGLGANAIVTGDISSTIVLIESKPHHFAIGETQVQVLKVVEL